MIRTSVVIATYNGSKYIQAQLKSILDQVDENTEIIISDNGSVDKTIEIINSFNDKRIKIYSYLAKKSVKNNFENALTYACGDVIFLADQDDIWMPDKYSTCLACLKENDIVVTDCSIINDNDEVVEASMFKKTVAGRGLLKNLMSNSYIGCCMAFKKNVLSVSLPFPENIPMHDIWIGFVSDLLFKSYFLNKTLLLYRRHGNNFSSTSEKSKYNFLAKLKFRYNLVKYIPLLFKRKSYLNNRIANG